MGCTASTPTQFTTTITTTATTGDSTTSSPFSDHHASSSSTPTPPPLVHHPSLHKGDSDHFVSLTSTTYGSLTDITKSIIDTPNSSPDSVINTWELMEGLDDYVNDLNCNRKLTDRTDYVSFGLGGPYEMVDYPVKNGSGRVEPGHVSGQVETGHGSGRVETGHGSGRVETGHGPGQAETGRGSGRVETGRGSGRVETGHGSEWVKVKTGQKTPEPEGLCLPGCEDRIVLYYTSLRGIRKTYEECCEIRLIFQGFRVFVDERDISLDSSYRDELKRVFDGKGFSLPQVFIKGKHVGSADEVKRLHEDGELVGLIKGFRVMGSGRVCGGCGDVRFVPCAKCSGSRKVFMEGVWSAVRCPECNENGLVRCVSCS